MASSRMPDTASKQDRAKQTSKRSTSATLAVVFILLGTIAGVVARESESEKIVALAQTSMMVLLVLAMIALIGAITRGKSFW